MDLAKLKVDAAALEAGVWVDNIPEGGDLAFRVRPDDSVVVKLKSAELFRLVSYQDRDADGRLTAAKADELKARVLAEAALVDWRGVELGGVPVPFSPAKARELLADPDLRVFRTMVEWAVDRATIRQRAIDGGETEGALGNSEPPPSGG